MSKHNEDERPSRQIGAESSTHDTEFEVVCITREPWIRHGHGHITHLGIEVGGATLVLTENEVVARVTAREKFYVSRAGQGRAYLEISHTRGRAYVKTIADRTTLNNLEALPLCDETLCPERRSSWWLLLLSGVAGIILGLELLIGLITSAANQVAIVILIAAYLFFVMLVAIFDIIVVPSTRVLSLLLLNVMLSILVIIAILLLPVPLVLAILAVLSVAAGITLVFLVIGIREHAPLPWRMLILFLLLMLSFFVCWLILIFDIDIFVEIHPTVTFEVTRQVTVEVTRQVTVTREATVLVPQTVVVTLTVPVIQTTIFTQPVTVTIPCKCETPTPAASLAITHTKGMASTSSVADTGQLLVGNWVTKTVTETQGTQIVTRTVDLSSILVFDEIKDSPFLLATKPITGFDQPFDIGIVKDYAFVSEVGKADVITATGSVGVIDLKSMTKSTEIDTSTCGQRPTHIAVNGHINKVYVTLDSSGWLPVNPTVTATGGVAVIDTSNLGVTCVQTPSLRHPFGIAAKTQTNQFYVGDRESDTLQIFDGNKNTVMGKYSVGTDVPGARGIYHVALSPDEKRLYVVVDAGSQQMLLAYQVPATEPYLTSPVKAGIMNTYDGGWVMESKCSGLIYVAATNLDSNFSPLSGLPEVLVLNNDLSGNKILSSADGIGSQPFSLAQNLSLRRIYVGSKGDLSKGNGRITILSEPTCKVR